MWRAYEPAQRADGTWQVVLPPKVFDRNAKGKGLPLTRLGSFVVLGSDLMHVWCPDERLRHDALLRRMDAFLAPRARVDASDVETRLGRFTRQLDLGAIDLPALRHMAKNAGLRGLLAQLDFS